MQINIEKSACMRIGIRYKNTDHSILIKNIALSWKQEIKYLGICILSGNIFSCNLQGARQKFFRAVNGIFGKIGVKSSPTVSCSLIKSYCLPILLFSLESVNLKKKNIVKLESAYSQSFSKMFNTYNESIIKRCQYFLGIFPLRYLVNINKFNFLRTIELRSGLF